jgi:hypothetical protein
MASKCENRCCPATRKHDEGKLFRLDLDLGSNGGGSERRTEYMWLCPRCAQRMHPKVEVNGNTVTVRLSRNAPMPLPDTRVSPLRFWVN